MAKLLKCKVNPTANHAKLQHVLQAMKALTIRGSSVFILCMQLCDVRHAGLDLALHSPCQAQFYSSSSSMGQSDMAT